MDKTTYVIPFSLPWDRNADYQRQTALELAKRGTVIAYLRSEETFFLKRLIARSVRYPAYKNIRFYCPVSVFPFGRFQLIRRLNRRINYFLFSYFVLNGKRVVLWIFDPEFYWLPAQTKGRSLYDCVDFHQGYCPQKTIQTVKKQEQSLIRSVDFFFVNSDVLEKLHQSTRRPTVVPLGFRKNDFLLKGTKRITLSQKAQIIGFVGSIDERIDFDLLQTLADRNTQWTIVLWGNVPDDAVDKDGINKRVAALARRKNVIHGHSKNSDVPAIIRQFTVGMIPYRVSHPGARYAYPMKIFEYFYCGKPVVSTPLVELKRFPQYIKIGENAKEWEANIHDLLRRPWPKKYQQEQRKLALENSWEEKIRAMLRLMNSTDPYARRRGPRADPEADR